MTAQPAPSNHPVFLLAEHLDMILAAIEDMQACRPSLNPASPHLLGGEPRISLVDFVGELKRFEMAAIVRLGRARILTRELVRRDSRFAMLGGLFVAGTAAFDEAVNRMTDVPGSAFASGGDPIGYLRSRGVIGEEAGGPATEAELLIDDTFRLAGEIEVGPLSDLVSTFLNTIELHFDLFPDISEGDDVRHDLSELVN